MRNNLVTASDSARMADFDTTAAEVQNTIAIIAQMNKYILNRNLQIIHLIYFHLLHGFHF